MGPELVHYPSQMPFVDRNQELETLAADGPDQTLAVGIRRQRSSRDESSASLEQEPEGGEQP